VRTHIPVSPRTRARGARAGAALLVATLAIACARGASSSSSGSAAAAAAAAPVLDWAPADSLETGRDHHVVFITRTGAGDWLHVVGGNTYRKLLADTWRARIGRDGALGPWQSSTPLPAPRGGLAVAVNGGAVVLTGGQLADPRLRNTTEVYVATLGADGAPGAWTPAAPLPGRRYHHASVYANGFVYVTGGQDSSRSTATVWRAPLSPDGTLGAWTALPDMPKARSHHAALVHDGALYLIAGLNGNPAGANEQLRDVVRAPIRKDGSLGGWTTLSQMDSAYATHSAFVHGRYLYVAGGVENNARFVDAVHRAALRRDGTLGPWEAVVPGLPNARAHVHQTPLLGDRVYSVAGSNRGKVIAQAWVGRVKD